MSISEQIENLRRIAKEWNPDIPINPVSVTLNQAADTIEALSEKLQAANMERSAEDCGKSVLKIDTPKVCIDCPCHFAGESGMVMCGVEKRELLSDNIETFKPDWCPLRESAEDYNGWIPCKEKLPEDGVDVLVWFEYFRYGEYNRLFQTKGISYTFNGEWSGFVNGQSGWNQLRIIAWQPLPGDYHEP